MITPNAPHWPKVRMGRSGGWAAFLRKAISRIGERNVGQKKNWRGIPTICGRCRVFSNHSHRSNLGAGGRVGIGNGKSTRAGLGSSGVA